MSSRSVVIIGGARTPFALAGTAHKQLMAVDLARAAIKGVLARTGLPPSLPQAVVLGAVVQEPKTSNVAREAALAAGLPVSTFSSTVTAACISANVAAQTVTDQILAGRIDCGIAGGVELMSDVPIRFSRAVRARMIASQKARGVGGYLKLLAGLKLADLAPELPGITEYSTGETMGLSSEKLASRWGVSRADADAFALRSHQLALKAHLDGRLEADILTLPHMVATAAAVVSPVGGAASGGKAPALGLGSATWDNPIKADSTLAKLQSLKPAFNKSSPLATHTAGNSSPLTDGASALLLMEQSRAAAEGLPALARIVDSEWVARDPKSELLLGPAYAIARLLHRRGLSASEVDVLEIHEAFAGQVLANFNALNSASWAWAPDGGAGPGKAVGLPPLERINAWGGSMSLGHPFGATGTRLLLTAARRLEAEGGRFAVVAACAAGGLGVATLLEAVPRSAPALVPASTAVRNRAPAAKRNLVAPSPPPATTGGTGGGSGGGGAISVEEREGGILIVRIDVPGEKLNILSEAVLREFEVSITQVEERLRAGGPGAPRAIVLTSGKPGTFIAGADIKMLSLASTEAQWATLSSEGHRMMNRLAKLPLPTVCAIDGVCMGGGFELALACSARICTPAARLSLPEVKLGLLPGAGGCTRLPGLIGAQAALGAMTTGKTFRPSEALKLGLVSAVVEPQALVDAAVRTAAGLLAAATTPAAAAAKAAAARKPRSWLRWAVEGNPLGRAIMWSEAKKAIDKATSGRFPAPYAILDAVRAGVEGGEAAGFAAEAKGFGRLGMTPESVALRGLFFSVTATKRAAAAPGDSSGVAPLEVGTLGVLGAGLMGAGIALVGADNAGLSVVLRDRDAAALQRGEAQISAALGARVKRRRLAKFEADVISARVLGVVDADCGGAAVRRALARADLVIEAVPEVLAVKHAVLREAQALMASEGAIFATNTSALPIADIAAGAATPALAARVVGMHFFSPVDKMPLCEIIPHTGTAPEVTATALAVAQKMGKTAIVTRDVPGFFVNRCLSPLLAEMVALVAAGVPPPVLDAALTSYGMPVGPCTLTDEVGVDVAHHVSITMAAALGVRAAGPDARSLAAAVARGFTGRKGGKGFYIYPAPSPGGKAKAKGAKAAREVNGEMLAALAEFRPAGPGYDRSTVAALVAPGAAAATRLRDRLVLRFLKECVHSLEDGVIRSPGDGDVGAVFGIGFPPHLGGPFRYIDQLGAASVVAAMRELEASVGPQYAPPSMLVEMAKAGGRFHGGK
jgi:enoyl-CoA hydratase / long-chain 3-hydroxyacyl-CoA dehydrogenase